MLESKILKNIFSQCPQRTLQKCRVQRFFPPKILILPQYCATTHINPIIIAIVFHFWSQKISYHIFFLLQSFQTWCQIVNSSITRILWCKLSCQSQFEFWMKQNLIMYKMLVRLCTYMEKVKYENWNWDHWPWRITQTCSMKLCAFCLRFVRPNLSNMTFFYYVITNQLFV